MIGQGNNKMVIELEGKDAYWVHIALEKMLVDEDNFIDLEDMQEVQKLHKNFYAQWYNQDKNIPKTWMKPEEQK